VSSRGDSSNFPLRLPYIDLARAQVELQTLLGTRLQSYIRPPCLALDEALALMDIRISGYRPAAFEPRVSAPDNSHYCDWFN